MKRLSPIVAIATTFLVAACGSAASAAKTSASPTSSAGSAFRNGASGQLVQINAQTLILTGPNGDITVTYSSSTIITKTSAAGLADVTVGTCAVATGQKAASGAITARSVRISPKTASGCATGAFAPNPGAGATPRPSPSPRPSSPIAQLNMTIVSGEVTAVSGTSVTVMTQTSGSQTITVPATAAVTKTSTATAAQLQTGQCLRANGTRDAAGNVQATSLAITPAGPSGTCTTGLGGRGGAGGGAPPNGASSGA